MTAHQSTIAPSSAPVATRTNGMVQALLVALLGTAVLGFVGFAHIDAVHNAAHDVRHANGFPCH